MPVQAPAALGELIAMHQEFAIEGVRLQNARLVAKDADSTDGVIGLAGTGLNSESGEVNDELKKYLYHGKDFNRKKIIDEMGDVLWYYNVLLGATGITWEEVILGNIEKLTERRTNKTGSYSDGVKEPVNANVRYVDFAAKKERFDVV